MKKYYINSVIPDIQNHFTDAYSNASQFTGTPLFYQCMGMISSIPFLNEIIAENDRGIPPVQTLLELFEKHGVQIQELTDFDSICIGEFMAFLFKHILGYRSQKDNVPINNSFGVKTAALYYENSEGVVVLA